MKTSPGLPASQEAKRKFAKEFVELNEFLEAAKVQGFTWEQDIYEFEEEAKEGDQRVGSFFVQPVIDERTYLTLVQRYKELFSDGVVRVVPPMHPMSSMVTLQRSTQV